MNRTFLHNEVHRVVKEVKGCLLHVLRDVRADDRPLRVRGQSSSLRLDEVPKRLEFADDAFAEVEGFDSAKADISLSL